LLLLLLFIVSYSMTQFFYGIDIRIILLTDNKIFLLTDMIYEDIGVQEYHIILKHIEITVT